ncbi:DNA topoisomerase, partial [Neisseria gonorrhoeae]|uniref:DNA topoisomerase n=1 Tax=Neisseria gonorrhoeae TaxID=485 RepID=UPI0034E95534
IIPTVKPATINDLTEDEKRVYLLIARAYIAQFWPDHEYNQTDIEAEIAGKKFVCRSNVTVKPGWMALYKNDQGNAETATDPEDLSVDLQMLKPGNSGRCLTAEETQFETKPRPLYTMDTLLNDLTRVAKYVQNPKLRELLIEKDKGKEGEHGGIGTPATRDEILRNLLDKGFLLEKGKNIVSSEIGQQLYDALPDQAKFPDMTALWHEQQQHIVQRGLDPQRCGKSLLEYRAGEGRRAGEGGI